MRASELIDKLNFGIKRRIPVIIQSESSECGLACLAMVANFHGLRTGLSNLRKKFPISVRGAKLSSLIEMASGLDLDSRAVRAELHALKELQLPCVLHWEFNHFVVLASISGNHAEIIDPAFGSRRITHDQLSESFTGVALELWPDPSFEEKDEVERIRIRDLIGRVVGLPRTLTLLFSLAVLIQIFTLVSPLFMQWVIDHAIPSRDTSLLLNLAVAFGAALFLSTALNAARSWWIMFFGVTWNVQWRSSVFSHLLRLPDNFFEKRNSSDILSRFYSLDAIEGTLTGSFVESVLDGLLSIFILTALFLYNAKLAILSVIAMLLYGAMRAFWYRSLRSATEEEIVYTAKQSSHFLETINGIGPIKLFRRNESRKTRWMQLLTDQVNANIKTRKLQIYSDFSNGLIFGVENILIVWFGALLVINNTITLGMLTAYIAYKMMFSTRVTSLIDRLVEFKMLALHGERLGDILLTKPEPIPQPNEELRSTSLQVSASLEVIDLSFSYSENDAFVFKNLNLRVDEGESVAVTGPSGCGKSTLVNLILGKYVANSGKILLGGLDTSFYEPDLIRYMISTVAQNDILLDGSVADNISFFDANADQGWIEECAKRAAIHDEIQAMPMRYHSAVGYMGGAISGGQKQRILIARALYVRPKILILDEATSHLDVDRERMVNESIKEMSITRIIIAHRQETIETADRIVVISGVGELNGRGEWNVD